MMFLLIQVGINSQVMCKSLKFIHKSKTPEDSHRLLSWYCEVQFINVQKFNIGKKTKTKKENAFVRKQFCLTQEVLMIVEGRSCSVQYTYIHIQTHELCGEQAQ